MNAVISISFFLSPKIIGRVNADPDYLPRTNDFGLDVVSFMQQYHRPQCPSTFLPLAALCCDMDADKRYACTLQTRKKKKKKPLWVEMKQM